MFKLLTKRFIVGTWFWITLVIMFVVIARHENDRFQQAMKAGQAWGLYLGFWDMETSLPLVLIGVLPLLFVAGWRRTSVRTSPESTAGILLDVRCSTGQRYSATVCVSLFVLTLLCSFRIGFWPVSVDFREQTETLAFADLPPAYHDEFSYLLQASTFREGHLSYPGADIRPDLFHQFHVLNEHRTVSRYFPLTGAWMAAVMTVTDPVRGHWLAGALITVFFYLSLRRTVSPRIAALAGILIAVSPGMAVFSNLLLAHHPTLLALSIFTYSFIRMLESHRQGWAFAAGGALTFAMLGRPMTAAGFALPYGLYFLRKMFGQPTSRRLAFGFIVPLAVGFITLGIQNYDATGSVIKSPYQAYTDKFTPSHKFGFYNAVETPDSEGPPALQSYDNWATNLTPGRAIDNVWSRLKASFQWSLGTVPILFGLLMVMPLLFRSPPVGTAASSVRNLRLMAWSIVTLHLVHVPYWFDGILHWHYVFETAPLLLALTTVGLSYACEYLSSRIGRTGPVWVFALVICVLLPGWFQLAAFHNVSKVSAAISEQAFSRTRMLFFNRLVRESDLSLPALILVDEAGTDPQLSYIINPPDYNAPTLVCRRPATEPETAALQKFYWDRTIYVFDPNEFRIQRWTLPTP